MPKRIFFKTGYRPRCWAALAAWNECVERNVLLEYKNEATEREVSSVRTRGRNVRILEPMTARWKEGVRTALFACMRVD